MLRRNHRRTMSMSMSGTVSKGKVQKRKGKGGEGKSGKQNWRQLCNDYWKPDGCQHGHHCPKYHPMVQLDIIHITVYTTCEAQSENAEYDEDSTWQAEVGWQDFAWE